jgi:1-acyl-sn-glycerol-3-phosphate acyltransferase
VLYRLLVLLGRPFIWLAFRPRVSGREHLPQGGFVLAANHLSGWDSVALAYAVPRRTIRNMAKRQLFVRPLVGPLVRSLGGFPATGGVDTAVLLARGGDVISIFPEGARRRGDRELRPRTGAARVALGAGVPLVPAAIRDTERWRRLGRWQVELGEPVDVDNLPGDQDEAAARGDTAPVGAHTRTPQRVASG